MCRYPHSRTPPPRIPGKPKIMAIRNSVASTTVIGPRVGRSRAGGREERVGSKRRG
jgi:hypothetical protein